MSEKHTPKPQPPAPRPQPPAPRPQPPAPTPVKAPQPLQAPSRERGIGRPPSPSK